jgi:hypothetical protein
MLHLVFERAPINKFSLTQQLLASLAYGETGDQCPPNCYAMTAVELLVRNRVNNSILPTNYFDVIFSPNQFDATTSQNFWNAFLTPQTLSGLQAYQYWYALNASVGVTDDFTSDFTGGATFFYSGSNPPDKFFGITLPEEGYQTTLVVPSPSPKVAPLTFLAPPAPGSGGG